VAALSDDSPVSDLHANQINSLRSGAVRDVATPGASLPCPGAGKLRPRNGSNVHYTRCRRHESILLAAAA
jgi:hypothetical protein